VFLTLPFHTKKRLYFIATLIGLAMSSIEVCFFTEKKGRHMGSQDSQFKNTPQVTSPNKPRASNQNIPQTN
jgi:hypothetical protein